MSEALHDGAPAVVERPERSSAEALLAHNPRLAESYLTELVADLDARLARVTATLRAEQAPEPVVAAVRDFYLARPFEAARPLAGQWRWRRDWAALVEAIGTPAMRERREKAAAHEARQAAEIREKIGWKPRSRAPVPAPEPPSSGRVDRLLRDDPNTAAAYAAARLGVPFEDDPAGRRLAARLDREAAAADLRAAERGRPTFDDGMAPDERIAIAAERFWTPARVLTHVMRPATRALARVRAAERAVDRAGSRFAAKRAVDELARVRAAWDVAPVLAADLEAERAALRPVIEAAIDGTSRRWRHRGGRVFDDQGVDLHPPCLRSWQVL